ncbi:MAG: hypothetical protein WKF94_02285 [Solirubrobacteraceae bacterium]
MDFGGHLPVGTSSCTAINAFRRGRFSIYAYADSLNPNGVIQGVVPEGFSQAIALDAEGQQLAKTAVEGSVYELEMRQVEAVAELRLVRSAGEDVTVTMGR